MNGQLWQECEARRCKAQPVCIDCELCEKHCTCPPEHPSATAPTRDAGTQELAAQWDAFTAILSPDSVTCEGPRLNAVIRGKSLPCPPPFPGQEPEFFQRGTTLTGQPVILAFRRNTIRAYGNDDALNELVLTGLHLTPQVAFDLLTGEYNYERGFRHTLNIDAPRIIRALGRERVITTASSAPHVRPLDGQGPDGPLHAHGEREVQEQYNLNVQWVAFKGYARNLTAQEQQSGLQSLYQHPASGAWYLSNHARTPMQPLTAEQVSRLIP